MRCTYGAWTLLYGVCMPFTVHTNCTDRQPFSTIRMWVSRSVRTLQTETIVPRSVTLPVYWTTLPENAGNGISETLNFNLFWGSMPPDPPRGERLRRSKYSLRAHTFKITCYAPAFNCLASVSSGTDLSQWIRFKTNMWLFPSKTGHTNRKM